jgi:hypothetical protein
VTASRPLPPVDDSQRVMLCAVAALGLPDARDGPDGVGISNRIATMF